MTKLLNPVNGKIDKTGFEKWAFSWSEVKGYSNSLDSAQVLQGT